MTDGKCPGFRKSVGWALYEDEEGFEHVVPVFDEYQHELSSECPCRPQIRPNLGLAHRAFDKRDLYENGIRKPH